jgi:hypothetical protein
VQARGGTFRATFALSVALWLSAYAYPAVAQEPVTAAPPGQGAPIRAVVAPVVAVRFVADDTARIESFSGTTWRIVCAPPCRATLTTDASYRVNGDGFRPSHPFFLGIPAPGEATVVEATTATQEGFVAGIVLAGAGAAAVAAGLALVFAGTRVGGSLSDTYTEVGIFALIGGVTGGLPGMAVLLSNFETKVRQRSQPLSAPMGMLVSPGAGREAGPVANRGSPLTLSLLSCAW